MAAEKQKTTYSAAEVAEMLNAIKALKEQNDELQRQLEHMSQLLLNAQRSRFGSSSEKQAYVLGSEQLSMFNEAEATQDVKAPEPSEETMTVKEHTRKKKRTVDELTAELPVRKILLGLPEEQMSCTSCGGKLKKIGEKFLRRELQIIPKQVAWSQNRSSTQTKRWCRF